MCGIAGIVEKGKDRSTLMNDMLDIIRHRGPDAKSVYVHQDVTLGHRRLSIVDLTTGDQSGTPRNTSDFFISLGSL